MRRHFEGGVYWDELAEICGGISRCNEISRKYGKSSECFGEFLIWRSRALPLTAIVYEITLAGFKFGDFSQNHQFIKLKTSPKFPAILYTHQQRNSEPPNQPARVCFQDGQM